MQRGTVLIVEDTLVERRLAVQLFARLGFQPLVAGTVAEARELLARGDISHLFAEISMPGGIDGVALARQARDDRPDLRILLTSSDDSAAVPDLPFLSKPWHPLRIEAAMASAPACGPAGADGASVAATRPLSAAL